MRQPRPAPDPSQKRDDVDTVAALVRMLLHSGYEPRKIEASLTKACRPAELDALAECFSELSLPRVRSHPGRRAA